MRAYRAGFLLVTTFAPSILLVGGLAAAGEQSPPESAPAARTDFLGDPLPPGALARMGSERLRHGRFCRHVLFSADGKELISLGTDGVIRFWDPETGKALRTLSVTGLHFTNTAAVSADGKLLAAAGKTPLDDSQSSPPNEPGDDWIFIWDAATHAERARIHVDGMSVYSLTFAPDGATLVSAGKGPSVCLWDAASGKVRHELQGVERPVSQIRFSPDGHLLAMLEASDSEAPLRPRLTVWDAASDKRLYRAGLERVSDAFFSPDGKTLVAWDCYRNVYKLDAATGEEKKHLTAAELPWPYVLGGDGKTLIGMADARDPAYVGGYRHAIVRADLFGQDEMEIMDGECSITSYPALSPDGKTLAAAECESSIRLWDLAGKKRKRILPGHDWAVNKVAFTSDGATLITSANDRTIRFWEAATGKELRTLGDGKAPLTLLEVSPSGASLAVLRSDWLVHVLDAASGGEPRPLDGQRQEEPGSGQAELSRVSTAAFSADGKVLAIGRRRGIELWNVAAGALLALPKANGRFGRKLAFSPNGHTLAAICEPASLVAPEDERGRIRLYDLTTGEECVAFGGGDQPTASFAFLPDGALICYGRRGQVTVRDALSGDAVFRAKSDKVRGFECVFSPDRRLWASTEAEGGYFVSRRTVVVETATSQEICRFEGQFHNADGLAFAPDGLSLAVGDRFGTTTLWDLRRIPGDPSPAGPLDSDALARLWDDLDAGNAVTGYRAVCRLAASPKRALELLTRRLPKAPPRDMAAIGRFISELDSNDFEARDEATRKLHAFGSLAELDLKEAARSPLPEVSQRARRLLAAIDRDMVPPGRLREIRAVQVLERIATPETRRLLKELAEGEPAAALTRDAAQAVERLAGRPAPR